MYTTPPYTCQQSPRLTLHNAPTDSDPTHDNAQCNRPLLIEPDSHQRKTRDIQQSRPKAHTYTLTQEDLPVLRA
jgi:hypothetical protein